MRETEPIRTGGECAVEVDVNLGAADEVRVGERGAVGVQRQADAELDGRRHAGGWAAGDLEEADHAGEVEVGRLGGERSGQLARLLGVPADWKKPAPFFSPNDTSP